MRYIHKRKKKQATGSNTENLVSQGDNSHLPALASSSWFSKVGVTDQKGWTTSLAHDDHITTRGGHFLHSWCQMNDTVTTSIYV